MGTLTDEALARLAAKIQRERAALVASHSAYFAQQLQQALPARLHAATWESLLGSDPPVPPVVLAELDRWCAAPSSNLVMLGSLRVGKTWAAAACLRRVAQPGHTVGFWGAQELLDATRERPGVMREAASVRWLILDDVGSDQPLHPMMRERLDMLINKRDLAAAPIIATSCLDKKQLEAWLGPRSFNRLRSGVRIVWAGSPR